ncbi:hypothetical protein EB796_004447 [Bugula neritina]|uniref:Uncharacterized protein n=1 Tax=Bugula neritina TaxID=10212 RepID=A0A7J7KG80_BUGNE|nr:hypothetical protein EB796_004447 [Bugula neritina]
MKVIAVLFAVCLALASAAFNHGFVGHNFGLNRGFLGVRRGFHSGFNSYNRFGGFRRYGGFRHSVFGRRYGRYGCKSYYLIAN